MGSGTTVIAAETTGRVCLGVELNPAYVDVAVERWQRFTGKAAILDGSGETFGRSREGPTSCCHGRSLLGSCADSAAGGRKGCRRAATGV
jgi:hypothetical protein